MASTKKLGNRFLDLTGKKYGHLTVLEFSHMGHHSYWKCRCDCGNVITVSSNPLKVGDKKSCGCSSHPNKLPSKDAGTNRLMCHLKIRSETRKHTIDISKDDVYKLSQQNCFYCGSAPQQFYETIQGFVYNGIDRVDNSKGYTLDNCVPCCGICNQMKGTRTQKFFLEQCRKIVSCQS